MKAWETLSHRFSKPFLTTCLQTLHVGVTEGGSYTSTLGKTTVTTPSFPPIVAFSVSMAANLFGASMSSLSHSTTRKPSYLTHQSAPRTPHRFNSNVLLHKLAIRASIEDQNQTGETNNHNQYESQSLDVHTIFKDSSRLDFAPPRQSKKSL